MFLFYNPRYIDQKTIRAYIDVPFSANNPLTGISDFHYVETEDMKDNQSSTAINATYSFLFEGNNIQVDLLGENLKFNGILTLDETVNYLS